MLGRVSVIVPSRNERFLTRTLQDVLGMARGDIEVLVVLDGAPETEPLPDDKRITVLRNGAARGIAAASWDAAQVATGEYLMKLDAHCSLGEGYDVVLAQACQEHWLLVPSRYQLKDETWSRGYGPIDYLYVTYPWIGEPQFGSGLHGKKWLGNDGLTGHYFLREKRDKALRVDDIMIFQGSLWFMRRDYFLALDGVDRRYWLWQEAQNIGWKVWQSGGECKVVKDTWYSHMHKGRKHGRGYQLQERTCYDTNIYSADFWMNDRWTHPLKVRGTRWVVEHFWPIPGWPEDWDNPRYQQDFTYRGQKVVWPS